jgi:hypothetical protein
VSVWLQATSSLYETDFLLKFRKFEGPCTLPFESTSIDRDVRFDEIEWQRGVVASTQRDGRVIARMHHESLSLINGLGVKTQGTSVRIKCHDKFV